VLRDFAAEGHQLLVFTCHEHMVKFFRGLKATVRELPARGGVAPKLELDDEPAAPVEIAPVVVKKPEKKVERVEKKVEKRVETPPLPPVDPVEAEYPLEKLAEYQPPAPKLPAAEADWERELERKPPEPAPAPEEEPFPRRRSLSASRIRRHAGPFDDATWQAPINDDLDGVEDVFHDFDADDDLEDEIESWDKSSVGEFEADDDDAEAA
jgi:hypothetical protein